MNFIQKKSYKKTMMGGGGFESLPLVGYFGSLGSITRKLGFGEVVFCPQRRRRSASRWELMSFVGLIKRIDRGPGPRVPNDIFPL